MRRRRRQQFQNQQASAAPPPAPEGGEPSESEAPEALESLETSGLEGEAGEAPALEPEQDFPPDIALDAGEPGAEPFSEPPLPDAFTAEATGDETSGVEEIAPEAAAEVPDESVPEELTLEALAVEEPASEVPAEEAAPELAPEDLVPAEFSNTDELLPVEPGFLAEEPQEFAAEAATESFEGLESPDIEVMDQLLEELLAQGPDGVSADDMMPAEPSFLAAAPEPEPVSRPAAQLPTKSLDEVVAGIDRDLMQAAKEAAPKKAAAAATQQKRADTLEDYIVFTLSGSDYALPIQEVAEIGRIPAITRLPNMPYFVRGITNLRGEVIAVLSLPILLGLDEATPSARGRVVFVQGRQRQTTGLLVDEVKGIQRVPSQQLDSVAGLIDDKVTTVLKGVHGRGDRLLNVIDLEQLFVLPEVQTLQAN